MRGKELPSNIPVVGLIGHDRAGKDITSEYLKNNFGFEIATFSDVLREYAQTNNLRLHSREDYWNTRVLLEQAEGPTCVFDRLYRKMEDKYQIRTFNGISFNGIRTPEIFHKIESMQNSLLIGINTLPEIRFERKRQNRKEDDLSWEEFLEDQQSEESMCIQQLLEHSAVTTIDNNGSTDEYFSKINSLISSRFSFKI